MRSILSLLFLLFCSSILLAQDYRPMPEDTVYWRGEIWFHDISIYDERDYLYKQEGDTILDSVSYNKLYYTMYKELKFIGGLRQDTTNRKVFVYLLEDSTEHLLYDFSLNVGDTLFGSPYLFYPVNIVDIDSVSINGNIHRRFYFAHGFEPIIEGIGGEINLLDGHCGLSYCSRLICMTIDGKKYYPSSNGSCDLTLYNSIWEEKSDAIIIKVSPNPTQGDLIFERKRAEKGEIQLINPTGKVVLKKDISSEIMVKLEMPECLTNGLYFLRFKSGNNFATSKVVLMR